MKQSNGQAKSLLIEAVADLLPPEVVAQPKRTFTLPWEHWLRKTLREEVATELHDLASPLKECLDAQSAKQVWTDFLEGKTSWSRVWSLFVLNRWARLHLAI
jgi:asparagine synthetase B (glutamine-hydrolysing)